MNPPGGLAYPVLMGIWWRRRRIQAQLVEAWSAPFLAALVRLKS